MENGFTFVPFTDNTVFTFHLMKGAKFHNGDSVDAAAFKRGWERIVNPKMATPSEINYHLAHLLHDAERGVQRRNFKTAKTHGRCGAGRWHQRHVGSRHHKVPCGENE